MFVFVSLFLNRHLDKAIFIKRAPLRGESWATRTICNASCMAGRQHKRTNNRTMFPTLKKQWEPLLTAHFKYHVVYIFFLSECKGVPNSKAFKLGWILNCQLMFHADMNTKLAIDHWKQILIEMHPDCNRSEFLILTCTCISDLFSQLRQMKMRCI